jgi:hypothetical protein
LVKLDEIFEKKLKNSLLIEKIVQDKSNKEIELNIEEELNNEVNILIPRRKNKKF